MFVCPKTREPLEAWYSRAADVLYPTVEGLPVLVPEPGRHLAQHGPFDPTRAVAGVARRPLGVDAPDAITPFLAPQEIESREPMASFLAAMGDLDPDRLVAAWASAKAPAGYAVDIGCGVGAMSRLMAAAGREVVAFDLSVEAVLLARALLTGALDEALVPTHRRGAVLKRRPFRRPDAPLHFAVADAAAPPLPLRGAAWVHLGFLLDALPGEAVGPALVNAVELLKPGGVLTLTTAYDSDATPAPLEPSPEDELRDALRELGLKVLEERDNMPAFRRDYDRRYVVRLSHCLALRR